jgi:hypothetical protein
MIKARVAMFSSSRMNYPSIKRNCEARTLTANQIANSTSSQERREWALRCRAALLRNERIIRLISYKHCLYAL